MGYSPQGRKESDRTSQLNNSEKEKCLWLFLRFLLPLWKD